MICKGRMSWALSVRDDGCTGVRLAVMPLTIQQIKAVAANFPLVQQVCESQISEQAQQVLLFPLSQTSGTISAYD